MDKDSVRTLMSKGCKNKFDTCPIMPYTMGV
jgi:hypothetical protein